mgnify:FL=1
MRQTTVTIRGKEMDVEIIRDSGCEPDTNSHEIEWQFAGMTQEEHSALQLTAVEEDAIFIQLSELEHDYFPDDVI